MKARYSSWMVLTCMAIVCVLQQARPATAGAVLGKNVFTDDFQTLDARYWTIDKFGGTLVGQALGRLEILIPPNAKGNPFWGSVESRSGFYIKPDSYFDASIDYVLLTWPAPNNGIRVALGVNVYDKKNKIVISLMAGRVSDPDLGGEVYMVYTNGQYYYSKTKEKHGKLEISRTLSGFRVHAGTIFKLYVPQAQYIGKISWTLSAWGHDWKFIKKPVKVGFDNCAIWSEKGFLYPK